MFPEITHSRNATCDSEIPSERACVEQLMGLRVTLRHLVVPLRDQSFVFEDNDTVVYSRMTYHAKVRKRHVALSFHRVREAIATKIIAYYFVRGMINLADVLNKHSSHAKAWTSLKPLLCWQGCTMDCTEDGKKSYFDGDSLLLDLFMLAQCMFTCV